MRRHGPFPEGAEPIGARQPADADVPPLAGWIEDTSSTPEPAQPGSDSATAAGDDPHNPVPASGSPYPGTPHPTSGGAGPAYGPFHGDPGGESQEGWSETPYGFSTPPGRRIEPTPPPERSRLVIGILAGLVAGLLLFGTGGYFAGRATAPRATGAPTPAPVGNGELGVFERNQVAVNTPDFAGSKLTTIAEGWLPYLSTCTRSGSPGGPKLNDGEKVRVRCTLDGMSAIFVEYASDAERDRARAKVTGQAADARTLTPGVAPATEQASPSGRTTGNYAEYAYRLTESGTTRTISGIWWDDAQAPVAGYLLAYWREGLGEKWDPMRDLWSRYA